MDLTNLSQPLSTLAAPPTVLLNRVDGRRFDDALPTGGVSFAPPAIPEPASLLARFLGLAVVAGMACRRREARNAV
jgi:hypothetical protein